jgi:signal transduction histidine kinase
LNNRHKILFLDDSEDDVELMKSELNNARVEFISKHVINKNDFIHAIDEFRPDIILADYSLPTFNGMNAFLLVKQSHPGIPFILVTGVLSEQLALDFLQEGVDDFVLKSSYKRLPLAIESAIRNKEMEKEKQAIQNELKKSHKELQLLLDRQQNSREEERRTIARDLHDELGQVLTTLKIDVSMLRKKVASNGTQVQSDLIKSELTSIIKLIDRINRSVRRISSGLRPEILDELGLIEAIQWHIREFEKRHEIKSHVELPTNSLSMDNNSSIALFRIIQEALNNVAKHSEASNVTVKMKIENDSLFLEIKDDGKGLLPESIKSSGALGIIGLRERVRLLNGKFNIVGKPGKGTMITVTVPFKKPMAISL